MSKAVRVFAPGSIGNVGPGLDILGLAIAGTGDIVEVEWNTSGETVIDDAGHPDLPVDANRNTASIAVLAVLRQLGVHRGVRIRIVKGLPLSGGQGGSAACAIAGAVAANLLCDEQLDHAALLTAALEAEATVAGRHLDNLAPSLLGGLVLVRTSEPPDVIRIPIPASLRIVLAHPDQRLATRESRGALPATLPRDVALQQAANLAAMVAGACLGDLALFGRAIDDRIAEPARAPLLPGFQVARAAALSAGALGCSISGAGPTSFAFADSDAAAARIAVAMTGAYRIAGVRAEARITKVDQQGARAL